MSGSNVVTFNYATWAALFPEFSATVTSPAASGYFDIATLYLDNTACSLVPVGPRTAILNMLTAHIAQLLAGSSQQPAGPLVGRINQAGEGSVNVSTELPAPGSAAWFAQTKYGLMAWAAMAPYRTGRYIAPPQVPLGAQSYPRFIPWP